MFRQFENDTIKIIKKNGEIIEDIRAGVQSKLKGSEPEVSPRNNDQKQ